MLAIVKNEARKHISGKSFLIELFLIVGLCLIASTAYSDMAIITKDNLPKAQYYSLELKSALSNLNAEVFSRLFLTDYIYKGYFSFFLVFTAIKAINTFSVDKESGNMKYTLLTGVKMKKLFAGKMLFLLLSTLFTIFLTYSFSFLIGCFRFGLGFLLSDVSESILVAIFSAVPAFVLITLIAFLSQIIPSSKIITAITLILVFVLGVFDTTTSTYRFSPFGGLSLFSEGVPVLNNTLVTCSFVSFLYLVILLFVLFVSVPKNEFYE